MGVNGGIEVSSALRRTVAEGGPRAERWLADLPAAVTRIAQAWHLEVVSQLRHDGAASIILMVTTGQETPAVLKLSVPHEEARHEAAALTRWAGRGSVGLLRVSNDGYTLLLERCDPGQDLWTVDLDEQLEVVTGLLPRLWTRPDPGDPFPELSGTVGRWRRQMLDKAQRIGVAADVARDARRWAAELCDGQDRRVLHGDFHPGNVLAARREPWLVVDPKPWIGDPAFDLAQLLANWVDAQPTSPEGAVEAVRDRTRQLADRLSLRVDRVLRWAVVKAIGWDFGRDATLVLHEAARGGVADAR